MASSTSILDYLGRGTHAARPTTPPIGTGALAVYYETDTGHTFVWSGSAWAQVDGTAGSTSLSGDSDVSITSPANNDVLTYDSASGKWKNKPDSDSGASGYDDASGTSLTYAAAPHGSSSTNADGSLSLTLAAGYNGIQADQTFTGGVAKAIRYRCVIVPTTSDVWGLMLTNSAGVGYILDLDTTASSVKLYRTSGASAWGSGGPGGTTMLSGAATVPPGTLASALHVMEMLIFIRTSASALIMCLCDNQPISYSDTAATDLTGSGLIVGMYGTAASTQVVYNPLAEVSAKFIYPY